MKQLHLVGCASGVAGADIHSGDGPIILQNSPYLAQLTESGHSYQWGNVFRVNAESPGQRIDESVSQVCRDLAKDVSRLTREKAFFSVIGGDHSCAIGTWSGVYDALHQQGEIGLIWIDAHMDSHTPETSESGRIHGMPLAVLLGYGYPTLTSILHQAPKIKPENLCLIGVRSYEAGEAALLKRLNVRVFMMSEVLERGFSAVMQEAIERVSKNTIGYGLTLDIDSIDPMDAPGVDVPEANGIRVDQLRQGLQLAAVDPKLIATEIVEFDPSHDKNHTTEKLVVDVLQIFADGKNQHANIRG